MASNSIEVYVKHPSGKNAQYSILPSQQMHALCALVATEEGLPKEHIRLKYQGKTLEGTKTAGWYGVRVETILKAEILVPTYRDQIVELPPSEGGESQMSKVPVSNLEPVSVLYYKVAQQMGTETYRINLQISGRTLPNTDTALMDAGVFADTKIVATIPKEKAATNNNNSNQNAEAMSDQDLQTIMSSFHSNGKQVEVVFSFDTTGSMHCYLREVRSKLRECITRLLQDIPGIRIGLIAHGDYCDDHPSSYVLRQVDLETNVDTLVNFAMDVPTTSGGDSPECYEWVLRKAQLLDWSEDSAKALVVIGDVYPHPPSYTDQGIDWRNELDILSGMGVKVYGVQAGENNVAEHFYKELAQASGGCYVKLGHISAITDMFLAVCYRESDDAMLDNFEQEVETAGEMTEAKKEMFTQLREKTKNKSDHADSSKKATSHTSRGPNQDWWNGKDEGSPLYTYDAQKDHWSPVSTRRISTLTAPSRPSSTTATTRRKPRLPKRCAIM